MENKSESPITTELAKLAADADLKMSAVLRECGIARQTWWRWRTGRRRPSQALRKLIRLTIAHLAV